MKKRRIVFMSFLLVAVLTIGVGFATLADTLTVGGRVGFRPSHVVTEDVSNAIHYDTEYEPVLNYHNHSDSVLTTFNASVSGLNSAVLTVAINGDSDVQTYTASATYKVVYQNDKPNLPTVNLDATANIINGVEVLDDFVVTVSLTYDEAGQNPVDELKSGEEAYVTVTVVYTDPNYGLEPSDPGYSSELVAGTVNVTLNFNIPD